MREGLSGGWSDDADAVDTRFGAVTSLGPIWAHQKAKKSDVAAAVLGREPGSVLTCKKCGSNRVSYVMVQKRSPDEPMTAMAKCNGCGARWSE
jgi:DNA-directed RNA polymerase subunit M/transcription elongation factor TFIIS